VSQVRRLEAPPDGWADLCARDGHSGLFLRPEWMTVVCRADPEFRPGWLAVETGGKLVGLWPFTTARRKGFSEVVSLPFGSHGGPILDPSAGPGTARELAAGFRNLAGKPGVVRFEATVFGASADLTAALDTELGAWARPFHTHVIDLTGGFDRLWTDAYDKESRTCVRKSERAGVEVAVETGPEAVDALYAMYLANSREWSESAPYTRAALEAALDVLGDDARIWMARLRGEPLVGNLTLYDRGRTAYPWIAGSSPEARAVRANHLLNDRMLRDACARGFRTWNFGGSAGNPGIEAFKESLGAERRPVLRYYHEARWRSWLRRSSAP